METDKQILDSIITEEQKLLSKYFNAKETDITILEVRHPVPTPQYIMGRDNGRVEVVIRAVVGRKPNKKDHNDIENGDWIKEDNRDY